MEKEYKYATQDADGFIKAFRTIKPRLDEQDDWECGDTSDWDAKQCSQIGEFTPIRINLSKHDYKIEDGLLIKVEKTNPNRHKHADLMIAYANDKSLQIQYLHVLSNTWMDAGNHQLWDVSFEYRIKPKTKTVRFRNYLTVHGQPCTTLIKDTEEMVFFKKWIGDWQEVEIEVTE